MFQYIMIDGKSKQDQNHLNGKLKHERATSDEQPAMLKKHQIRPTFFSRDYVCNLFR